ncbi:MAG: carbamoyl-phosphate synthase large subunit, partial [Desulfobacterales bacterium]|nr:carbamoyl-phosphate synthase large subunit [Desulfobacterales bacterium]
TMAIGRTFKEALQKGLRSLEIGRYGLGADEKDSDIYKKGQTISEIKQKLATPNSQRIFYLRHALLEGMPVQSIHELTGIDPWFLYQIKQIVDFEQEIASTLKTRNDETSISLLKKAKSWGFSDIQIACLTGSSEESVGKNRKALGIRPVYKLVDTCAAEFKASTPYYYSTYETESEARVSDKKKVIILGGGPNRIGQGIEFDYCCVHASFALREEGVESIMVNSNPETVSTDYDTSDKLYFEPLTKEDVLHIVETEKPMGVIVQFGGQTPLNLSTSLFEAGVPILGTQPESIDRAEDRELFQAMLNKLGLVQPANGTAVDVEGAVAVAEEIGYPVIVRPSYVLGGRAMKIVYNQKDLENFTRLAILASPGHPVLIDKFLEDAVELDVDAISDGKTTIIGGIMEHIEEAGIHSGDSACVLPPHSVNSDALEEIANATKAMASELNVIGLMNVQYAIKDNRIYVLEVNPRASRTIPFVSKATGVPLAKFATKVMLGRSLRELGLTCERIPDHISVKEAVFPFDRFPDVDTLLGPEMKSTGEVMGIDSKFGSAYAKAQLGAGQNLPVSGAVFISVKDHDKEAVLDVASHYRDMDFKIMATRGTSEFLDKHGISNKMINKFSLGRPHVVDAIKNKEIQLVINTGSGGETRHDGYDIRRAVIKYGVPYATTIAGAMAMCRGVSAIKNRKISVKTIQEYNKL